MAVSVELDLANDYAFLVMTLRTLTTGSNLKLNQFGVTCDEDVLKHVIFNMLLPRNAL